MHQGAVPDRLRRVCVHVHWHCGPRTLSRTDNLPGSWPDSDEDGIPDNLDNCPNHPREPVRRLLALIL